MSDPKPGPSSTVSPPQRTFKLYEFNYAYGRDAHHLVFIQREENSEALANFEEHCLYELEDRAFRQYPRVYTVTDLENIQNSCLDLLDALSHGNDSVSFKVVLGKIEVRPRDSGIDTPWYEEVEFDCKDPDWGDGFHVPYDQVADLQSGGFS